MLLEQLATVSQGVTLSRIQPTNPNQSQRIPLFTAKELYESLGNPLLGSEQRQFAEIAIHKQKQAVKTKQQMVLINLIAQKAVVVTKEQEGKLIPSNFAVVELHTAKINPYYFTWFINEHPISHRQLRIATQGSSVSALSIQMLRELKIVLPPMEKQQILGKMYQLSIRKKILNIEREKLEEILIKHLMLQAIQEECI